MNEMCTLCIFWLMSLALAGTVPLSSKYALHRPRRQNCLGDWPTV